MTHSALLSLIKQEQVEEVDLRFTDLIGKTHHLTLPVKQFTPEILKYGKAFDGSSIAGWQPISKSDMSLMPDLKTATLDPLTSVPTLILQCYVHDACGNAYPSCPRSIAAKAEQHLQASGIAETLLVGPEPEFFVFDDVRFETQMHSCFYSLDSTEAAWQQGKIQPEGNHGHRPSVKGGYFPVPPVDACHDLRRQMSAMLEKMGLEVEAHHHEVATAGQNEIATRCRSLLRKADEMQHFKYVIQNMAHQAGKTATFMPKPLVGDNGSGMHCHLSLIKQERNLFDGDHYANLSDTALYFIGGVFKHAHALNAFTNPSTNSYKRLVRGFEAPVILAYSAQNRSASIRVPLTHTAKARRIEVRFPDATANPYLAFSAFLMAGLDGIKHQIDPGEASESNLYDLPDHVQAELPQVASSLEEALHGLNNDRAFLLHGGVFTDAMIDAYLNLKHKEALKVAQMTHPVEFEMYYSL